MSLAGTNLIEGTYTPPKDCTFTNTIFNLSVTSSGINYDRLGLVYFGDIEVMNFPSVPLLKLCTKIIGRYGG